MAVHEHLILLELLASESQHLLNDVVYIQLPRFCGCLLYEAANPGDNSTRTSPVGNNFFKSPPENFRIEITISHQSQACAAIVGNSSQWLIDFMGNGSCQFTHGREPGDPSKLRLGCVQGLSRVLQPFLSALL